MREGQEVARHGRIWEKEQVCFEPLHYLALLETQAGSTGSCPAAGGLDVAGVFRAVTPPTGSRTGRRRHAGVYPGAAPAGEAFLARSYGGRWNRRWRWVRSPAMRSPSFFIPGKTGGATVFSLDGHPHLRHVHVAAPNLASYT